MKYKVGDKIVTTSGLCSGCIPVGAVGVVQGVITNNCVSVDFGDTPDKLNQHMRLGKEWMMFDHEIELVV